MKILSAKQTQEVDKFTIENEPIKSIDLMERASNAFIDDFITAVSPKKKIAIVCGRGNNGGDGLAIARLLIERNYEVDVFCIQIEKGGSEDFEINKERLQKITQIQSIEEESGIPTFENHDLIIDGIFGSGLSRPVEGLYASVINAINSSSAIVYAIDIASGLFADQYSEAGAIVKAHVTLSFQLPKLAFLQPGNASFVGNWKALDIGLDTDFIDTLNTHYQYIDQLIAKGIIKSASKFDHKGSNGRALLVTGSYGKMGASVLSSRAAMRSGLGLLTVHSPSCGYDILQSCIPEAMVSVDEGDHYLVSSPQMKNINALGIGPGIGMEPETVGVLASIFQDYQKPIVIDADALNIISENRELLEMIPEGSILTPHPKEFERLVGDWQHDFERMELQKSMAERYKIIVVVKGAHTSIALPNGKIWFNSSGNPGMATGGSGDVLTGIITSLLAQQYPSEEAAILGVYIHGKAGDQAAGAVGKKGMIASDIVDFLPSAINFVS